ncbi:MAG: F0F1 ATP synthase subunit A [Helicobacter sp.]|nr:F0F1 ATP synthase subunit A [Helicobacter sp.]
MGLESQVFTFASLLNSDHIFIVSFYTILSAVITIFIGKLATRKMQIVPFGIQNLYEGIIDGILLIANDVIGRENARKYFPLAGGIAFFVFFCNMIGIIPGFESPTANWNFTLVLALVVFFYYHFEGIKAQGFFKYFGHFMGPLPWLAWLMFPIEIISHLSRIISLAFRLFGNIKGDDLFLLIMLILMPYLVPVAPFFVLFFMGILQAFVFMILTYVYLAGAIIISEDH